MLCYLQNTSKPWQQHYFAYTQHLWPQPLCMLLLYRTLFIYLHSNKFHRQRYFPDPTDVDSQPGMIRCSPGAISMFKFNISDRLWKTLPWPAIAPRTGGQYDILVVLLLDSKLQLFTKQATSSGDYLYRLSSLYTNHHKSQHAFGLWESAEDTY